MLNEAFNIDCMEYRKKAWRMIYEMYLEIPRSEKPDC